MIKFLLEMMLLLWTKLIFQKVYSMFIKTLQLLQKFKQLIKNLSLRFNKLKKVMFKFKITHYILLKN